jgi:hypothetical protein
MNDPQSQDENNDLLNFDEAKAAIEKHFASLVGTLSINNALLEKQVQRQDNFIKELQSENAKLTAEYETVRERLRKAELALLAKEAKAVIDGTDGDRNKKAASTEAA